MAGAQAGLCGQAGAPCEELAIVHGWAAMWRGSAEVWGARDASLNGRAWSLFLRGRVGVSCDRVEPSCDQVEGSCDQVEGSCDQVEGSCDRVEGSCGGFEPSCDRVVRSCVQFAPSCGRFAPLQGWARVRE